MNGHTKREIIPLERKEINLEKPKIKSIGLGQLMWFTIIYVKSISILYTRAQAHLILEPNQPGPAQFWPIVSPTSLRQIQRYVGPSKWNVTPTQIIIILFVFLWDFVQNIVSLKVCSPPHMRWESQLYSGITIIYDIQIKGVKYHMTVL